MAASPIALRDACLHAAVQASLNEATGDAVRLPYNINFNCNAAALGYPAADFYLVAEGVTYKVEGNIFSIPIGGDVERFDDGFMRHDRVKQD